VNDGRGEVLVCKSRATRVEKGAVMQIEVKEGAAMQIEVNEAN
jgi:hypothetical protein